MRLVPAVLLAVGCARPVDLHWRLPDHGALVVSEERSVVTRTPLGLEEVTLSASAVWRVVEPGRVGEDEVSWSEEVTAWTVSWAGGGGALTWELGSDEPLPDRLSHLAPPPRRTVWIQPGGAMSVRVDPGAANAESEAPVRRPVSQVPPWVAGLARVPAEPVKLGASWAWSDETRVTPASVARTTVTWTFAKMAGPQAVLVETIDLEGSPPPVQGTFQTTNLEGGGELRLDTQTGFPVKYTESFDADIASPSARGSAVRRTTVTLEVL